MSPDQGLEPKKVGEGIERTFVKLVIEGQAGFELGAPDDAVKPLDNFGGAFHGSGEQIDRGGFVQLKDSMQPRGKAKAVRWDDVKGVRLLRKRKQRRHREMLPSLVQKMNG